MLNTTAGFIRKIKFHNAKTQIILIQSHAKTKIYEHNRIIKLRRNSCQNTIDTTVHYIDGLAQDWYIQYVSNGDTAALHLTIDIS